MRESAFMRESAHMLVPPPHGAVAAASVASTSTETSTETGVDSLADQRPTDARTDSPAAVSRGSADHAVGDGFENMAALIASRMPPCDEQPRSSRRQLAARCAHAATLHEA